MHTGWRCFIFGFILCWSYSYFCFFFSLDGTKTNSPRNQFIYSYSECHLLVYQAQKWLWIYKQTGFGHVHTLAFFKANTKNVNRLRLVLELVNTLAFLQIIGRTCEHISGLTTGLQFIIISTSGQICQFLQICRPPQQMSINKTTPVTLRKFRLSTPPTSTAQITPRVN